MGVTHVICEICYLNYPQKPPPPPQTLNSSKGWWSFNSENKYSCVLLHHADNMKVSSSSLSSENFSSFFPLFSLSPKGEKEGKSMGGGVKETRRRGWGQVWVGNCRHCSHSKIFDQLTYRLFFCCSVAAKKRTGTTNYSFPLFSLHPLFQWRLELA